MLLHAITWAFSLERCKYDTSKWQKMTCKVYLVIKKWTKKEISSLAKFMPKHDWGLTPNVTKDNDFTSFSRIITTNFF
jgi:hypothetical protein